MHCTTTMPFNECWLCLSLAISCTTSLNTKAEYVTSLVLFREICPEYITHSPERYIMDLHILRRQVVVVALYSNSRK
jgi:hypothetical protein